MMTQPDSLKTSSGILSGTRVIEFAGLGPGPFAAMLLADQGADVIRIERPNAPVYGDPAMDQLNRGKRSVALNLSVADGVEAAWTLIESADVVIEGYRPGVMEKLGFGPDACLSRRPRLVYGRMTGWGQDGPLARVPGHDLNYLAVSGALHAIGPQQGPPSVPLNLIADFGGGGMILAYGIGLALLHVARGGAGQVVDASMVDGVAAMMAMTYSYKAMGLWKNEREANLLDGGSPQYRCYQCRDGKWMSVAAIEPKFWQTLLDALDVRLADLGDPMVQAHWPRQHAELEKAFLRQTRDEWVRHFEGRETCIAPVLDLDEAPVYPHHVHRGTFLPFPVAVNAYQPGIAPRFSLFPHATPGVPCRPGEHTSEVLNVPQQR